MTVEKGEFYRHKKGGLYQVIEIATHTETLERYVIYQDKDGHTWARPYDMFTDGRFEKEEEE